MIYNDPKPYHIGCYYTKDQDPCKNLQRWQWWAMFNIPDYPMMKMSMEINISFIFLQLTCAYSAKHLVSLIPWHLGQVGYRDDSTVSTTASSMNVTVMDRFYHIFSIRILWNYNIYSENNKIIVDTCQKIFLFPV